MVVPIGFRFSPTDKELVCYYLRRNSTPLHRLQDSEIICELDIYQFEPSDLPGRSVLESRDTEWFFFSPREKKYQNGARTNRATGEGYWKATGKGRKIMDSNIIAGIKKTLVYYKGRAPSGERTDWVMHEYCLTQNYKDLKSLLSYHVLCKIFKKGGPGPRNGEQHGAPLIEDEELGFDISPHSESNSLTVAAPEMSNQHFEKQPEMSCWNFEDQSKMSYLNSDSPPEIGHIENQPETIYRHMENQPKMSYRHIENQPEMSSRHMENQPEMSYRNIENQTRMSNRHIQIQTGMSNLHMESQTRMSYGHIEKHSTPEHPPRQKAGNELSSSKYVTSSSSRVYNELNTCDDNDFHDNSMMKQIFAEACQYPLLPEQADRLDDGTTGCLGLLKAASEEGESGFLAVYHELNSVEKKPNETGILLRTSNKGGRGGGVATYYYDGGADQTPSQFSHKCRLRMPISPFGGAIAFNRGNGADRRCMDILDWPPTGYTTFSTKMEKPGKMISDMDSNGDDDIRDFEDISRTCRSRLFRGSFHMNSDDDEDNTTKLRIQEPEQCAKHGFVMNKQGTILEETITHMSSSPEERVDGGFMLMVSGVGQCVKRLLILIPTQVWRYFLSPYSVV